MKQQDLLSIDLGAHSYEIWVGDGLLSDVSAFERLGNVTQAVIVSNVTVSPLYLAQLESTLKSLFSKVIIIELPDGEAYKNWDVLNIIFTKLLEFKADRKSMLFALGGGVIGDMTGFAAACYMRGIPYVQVPTTLLAQVDSSVGGKTAINHPMGKNMIGAFYQPKRVISDISTLKTLPQRELSAGLAEVIKYGLIFDSEFLVWLDQHLDALIHLEPQSISYAIRRSCEIKAEVVAQDERESGLRAILNLGHTFGHAIETGLGYGVWLHGEAVACGMVMAADLSCRMGLLPQENYIYLKALIERAGLPVKAPALGVKRYMELMQFDKKTEGGQIRFVLLQGLGQAVIQHAPDDLVHEVIETHQ